MTSAAGQSAPSDARFAFGANWRRFLDTVDAARIRAAEDSLVAKLRTRDLTGLRVLDIGCGSGLFSLAARNLGATVSAFDYDPQSVACSEEMRRRYRPDDDGWTIAQGSVLDPAWMARLGHADIVYSWGVLHHTGAMWEALAAAADRVAPGGRLYIAIYNDQGLWSRRWTRIKRLYVTGGRWRQRLLLAWAFWHIWGGQCVRDLVMRGGFTTWRGYGRDRGMSAWHDLVDWVGGYPFEVATPEAIFEFHRDRGFVLDALKTCGGGIGCNEFLFTRPSARARE